MKFELDYTFYPAFLYIFVASLSSAVIYLSKFRAEAVLFMSKQYRGQGNGGNDNHGPSPTNNDELSEELKAAILHQCYPSTLSKTKDGCLKFSIRGGHLAINHILEEKEMCAKSLDMVDKAASDKQQVVGMSRAGLKTLIYLVGETLKEMTPIDHATVYMYFVVGENGEYDTGRLVVEKGIHHPRF
jgi:hypothetical protein